jgi:hypothetical protein
VIRHPTIGDAIAYPLLPCSSALLCSLRWLRQVHSRLLFSIYGT